ncbi:MAG: MASE1 domain-containing protein [Hyphomicrobiales bacterium]
MPVALDVVLTAVLVATVVRFSVDFTMGPEGFGTFRLANGIVLGILLSVPRKFWPAYLAAGYFGNIAGTIHLLGEARGLDMVGLIAGIVTLERAACALALHPFLKQMPNWGGRRFVLAFIAIALVAAPLGGAALTATAYAARTGREFATVFFDWFVSGSLGMAMSAPLVLIARNVDFGEFVRQRLDLEALAIFAATALAASAIFFYADAPVAFIVLPPIVLAGFRTGLSGTVVANFLMAAIVTIATIQGHGPFSVSPDPIVNLRFSQMFVFISILISLSIAVTVIGHRRAAMAWKTAADGFEQLLHIDQTTELPNWRALVRSLQTEWDAGLKARQPLSLAIISLDGFDKLWDNGNRAAMDESIAGLSRNLRLLTRRTDMLARFSEREFALLMPASGKQAAQEAAQELFDIIGSFNFASAKRKPALSIGIATLRPRKGRDAGQLPDLADLALVHARRKGGNCIEWRGEE